MQAGLQSQIPRKAGGIATSALPFPEAGLHSLPPILRPLFPESLTTPRESNPDRLAAFSVVLLRAKGSIYLISLKVNLF
jgi:hypothetical protein